RHVEDCDLAHLGADAIPFRPELCQATQDKRVTVGQLDIIMIGVFSADRDHMRGEVGGWVPARCQWVHHNHGALARRDLEKIVAEVLQGSVSLSRVCRRDQAAGYRAVLASRVAMRRPKPGQEEGETDKCTCCLHEVSLPC